jgi:2-phospho-L-lactate guanylyltransferase
LRLEAIIALKTRGDAKRRLSADLTDEARESLVEAMALDVIAALSASPAIMAVHVICGEGWAQFEELPAPVRVWREPDAHSVGLVGALEWVAGQLNSDALLFVHGDLPFIDTSDIAALVLAAASESAVVSPDRSQTGTNALLRWQSQSLPLAFGENSYARHLAAITTAGLHFREVSTMGLAMDIDAPDDLQLLETQAARLGTHTTAWWKRYGGSLFKGATQKAL